MNIPKATKTLEALERSSRLHHWTEGQEATRLGIEALKRVVDVRCFLEASNWKPLPGETEN